MVRLTLSDNPVLVVVELIASVAGDGDITFIGTAGRIQVGVGNAQWRTANSCNAETQNFTHQCKAYFYCVAITHINTR